MKQPTKISGAWDEQQRYYLHVKKSYKNYHYTNKETNKDSKNKARQVSLGLVDRIEDYLQQAEYHLKNKSEILEFSVVMRLLAEDFLNLKRNYFEQIKADRAYVARQKLGKFDRGTKGRKCWYALWIEEGKSRNIDRPKTNRVLARVIEGMKAGKIEVPAAFRLEWFTKMLHRDSKLSSPALSLTYTKNFSKPEMLKSIKDAHKHKLPPHWEDAFKKVST